MRKRQIFLGLLLVMVLMAFAACSNNGGTALDPNTNTPNPVTDDNGTVDENGVRQNVDQAGDDLRNATDNAGNAARDLVTSDGAVDSKDNSL